MWKIFAGVTAAILIALLIFMNTGDRVENPSEAAVPAAVEIVEIPAEPTPTPAPPALAHRTMPTPGADPAAAEREESVNIGKPMPSKVSTTGTTFVLPKDHTPK